MTWKSIRIIYLLKATTAPSFVLIKWRSQKILSGQQSGLRRLVWPWPLNIWPENQFRDHLLIEGISCTKFGIDQMKGSKDIERTTFGLHTDRRPTDIPTDRELQNNMPPFSRGTLKLYCYINVRTFIFMEMKYDGWYFKNDRDSVLPDVSTWVKNCRFGR